MKMRSKPSKVHFKIRRHNYLGGLGLFDCLPSRRRAIRDMFWLLATYITYFRFYQPVNAIKEWDNWLQLRMKFKSVLNDLG